MESITKKIAVIPIDNRPICYTLISDILAQDRSIELFMPKRESLGNLVEPSNIDEIYNFVKNMPHADYFIIALDTIAYGGLVSSRRSPLSFDQIKNNLEKFKNLLKEKADKIYVFSSIMRISNNNVNEEEKEYWAQWGKRIFEFSYHQHKSRKNKSYNCVYNQIPEDILNDYLDTRKRNFEINKLYLEWLREGIFDTLVYSKDDTGEYGLNVEEAEFLEKAAKDSGLNAYVKTGADEIPLTLIARALCDNENISATPVYTNPQSIDLVSKYEDISVKDCVLNQLELANCKAADNGEAVFLINNFESEQGDLVLGSCVNILSRPLKLPDKAYFIADINNANGADDGLVWQMLNNSDTKNLLGYCAYNTSANSIGCAILCAVTKILAQKHGTYNDTAFKKLIFTRLADDWAYQAHIRKYVRENAPDFDGALNKRTEELIEYTQKIAKFSGYKYSSINFSLPWNRSFEVEINVSNI